MSFKQSHRAISLFTLVLALCWTVNAFAQSQSHRTIGFLSVRSFGDSQKEIAAFRAGLKSEGFVDGTNVAVDYRWGNGNYERVRTDAAELVNMKVSLIVAFGPVPALAAKTLTSEIPIVFTSSADPVKVGLVSSLSKPKGNVTGISYQAVQLNPKRLEILNELAPSALSIGTLINPEYADAAAEAAELTETAARMGNNYIPGA